MIPLFADLGEDWDGDDLAPLLLALAPLALFAILYMIANVMVWRKWRRRNVRRKRIERRQGGER